ncbi:hypothetical protein MUA34_05415 [Staphylococcus delphini]|uniref:hypothetical protein n=1 Tax=Staphylococcus delphini TaxID=53344 RepID=UPI0021CF8DCA|nr:hypothetical protein [Staphylococcus delphini]UXS37835.1 hypothetical protein MUA34_05415 [Staphylococcus delphini]
MEIILLLITSGIPGFYTYYSLSSKNIVYFDNDNKNIILSFFSTISVLIFLLVLSLFSGINNVNELLNYLSFTKIILALLASIILVVILTEMIYPLLLDVYNRFINTTRNSNGLSKTNTLPMHIKRYEDEKYQIVIFIKDFENNLIDSGLLTSYSRKQNRNIIIQNLDEQSMRFMLENVENNDTYIDFENNIKLEYYYVPTKVLKTN